MDTRKELIQKIISEINKLPESKLEEVIEFIDSKDFMSETQRNILKFAGSWSDLDKSILDDLTIHLHKNRKNNGIS